MSLAEQIKNETPDLVDIILSAIRANQLELNTCMPAVVRSYDAEKQTATVQPSFKRLQTDPRKFVSRPEIDDVPVVFPRAGGRGIVFPIAEGDAVMLVFSQRSLDTWLDNGGEIDLKETRLHNINDAIAIPGLYSEGGALVPQPIADGTELRGDKILIGNSGTSDEPMVLGNVLQTNLEDLITAIEDLIALITTGQAIGATNLGSGVTTSTVVTTAVEAALSSVTTALADQNSDFIFGEKAP